jgi:hypothetical protein
LPDLSVVQLKCQLIRGDPVHGRDSGHEGHRALAGFALRLPGPLKLTPLECDAGRSRLMSVCQPSAPRRDLAVKTRKPCGVLFFRPAHVDHIGFPWWGGESEEDRRDRDWDSVVMTV